MTAKSISSLLASWDAQREGALLYRVVEDLFPICRSITGQGLRQSLQRLQEAVPLEIREVPTGTQVLDWEVPREWNFREAWIKGPGGETIVDVKDSNLHILNYSIPVRERMSLAQLKAHLFSLPDRPDWIPYRTSYYRDNWGFCLPHQRLESLPDGEYEVCIDASLEPGSLSYGELLVKGESEEEILISAHSCHPSLANDNLSGMAVALGLARHLRTASHRYSYRFIWAPGTIGAITWLARNESRLGAIRHGLILSCLGDSGGFTYKRSRRGRADIDRVAAQVLGKGDRPGVLRDFIPLGYDERQYCSPGFNLPVGCLMRTPHGEYPEYHTSADNLQFVTPAALAGSLCCVLQLVEALEADGRFVNRSPKGEPQLGRRGLYRQMGGEKNDLSEEALLWVLNLSDGEHSLLDIAERSGLTLPMLRAAADVLVEQGLCQPAP